MRQWLAAVVVCLACVLSPAAPALAAEVEARVALVDGKLDTKALTRTLCDELKLPASVAVDVGQVDLTGVTGSLFVAALHKSLGDGCRISVERDALVLRIDSSALPSNCNALKKATRTFAAEIDPDAAEAQAARWGMKFPRPIDPAKRLVVLVHGLDCDCGTWSPISDMLVADGYQVAFFNYPSDQPIGDSAALFAQHMIALRAALPNLAVDVVAHSMGGLVARAYVEGDEYAGGVGHLVMLATPNRGSSWAKYRLGLELQEHYSQWRHDPDWKWTWMLTDGLGEAGGDLKPHSAFLESLNARPRRDGVQYTIVAGSQHPGSRMTANALEQSAGWIRGKPANWWGLRHTKRWLERGAGYMSKPGDSDGPVKVSRTKLKGVDDLVVLPVDHASICFGSDGNPPAAYDVIRDRLSR